MTQRIKIDDLQEFDAAPYLDNKAAIASYLTDILAANDAGLLAAALGDIARARGMTEIAKQAGLTREALYKALRPNSEPRFDTVNKVCSALGVQLVAQPQEQQKDTAPIDQAYADRIKLAQRHEQMIRNKIQPKGSAGRPKSGFVRVAAGKSR